MVKNSVISLSIAAAVFALSGCGGPEDSAKVSSEATAPTAHLKETTPQELIDSKKKAFESLNDSTFKKDSKEGTKLVEKSGQSLKQDLQKGGAAKRMEKQSGDELDPCIEITGTSSDYAIDKTVTFNHCDLGDDSSLNGTFTVKAEDENASGTETGNATISVSNLNLKKDSKNEILISTAKFSADWEYNKDESSITTKGNASAGISAYLKSEGKKILILDGLNGKASLDMEEKKKTESNDHGGSWSYYETTKGAYTGSIEGFIGDDDGLLKVETPKMVKGDAAKVKHCPSEGKITLTDADGKKAIFSADGKSITLTYNEQSKTLEECKSE